MTQEKMEHVMIDLETLDTAPSAIFLSLAAIQFNPDSGEIGKTLKLNVDLKSSMDANRTMSADTLNWWMTSDKQQARFEMLQGARLDLKEAMELFYQFIAMNELKYPWGNAASFDLSILNHATASLKMETLWNFRNERCYRTFTSEFAHLVPEHLKIKPKDFAHLPEFDANYQIQVLCSIKTALKSRETIYSEIMGSAEEQNNQK